MNEYKHKPPQPVFAVNPMLLQYPRRYILGTNPDSLGLFFRLCSMHMYVNGFVDDELAGESIYHKKIYKMENVSEYDSVLIGTCENSDIPSITAFCAEPIVLNPKINLSELYIYGAGGSGKKLCKYLEEKNITVKGFIDSDVKKVSTAILGKKVYNQSILNSLKEDVSVIEAGKFYKEIDSVICSMNGMIERFYFVESMWRDNALWVEEGISFDGVVFLDSGLERKKIFLCGEDERLVEQYYELFHLLDFEDVRIAKWSDKMCRQTESEPVCCIEELLLEDDYILVFCELPSDEDEKKLHNLGLERGRNFCDFWCNVYEKKCREFQMLDINLAFTRDMGGDFPGIAIHGKNAEDDYKIVVLGGSTSTSGFYWFRSWPQILYEEYYSSQKVTILNGAVESYTSAQELVKLMRDIVCLKPDMVLVYDGNNDVARDASYNIFYIPYMTTIMEYANRKAKSKMSADYKIFNGISCSQNMTDVWLKNIEYMNAVCELNHIKFYSFMQPMLFSKKEPLSKTEKVLNKKWSCCFKLSGGVVENQTREFRKRAPQICASHEYIHDLSHIFDGEDNVYIDHCHVFEKGNQIIAREVYKTIDEWICRVF